MHTGGEARRGKTSNDVIALVVPEADYVVVVASGNKDKLFNTLAAKKNVPVVEVEKMADAGAAVKAALQVAIPRACLACAVNADAAVATRWLAEPLTLLADGGVLRRAGRRARGGPSACRWPWPRGLGAAPNGDCLPFRHLVEGAFSYLDPILVIATAMIFMRVLADGGALASIGRAIHRSLRPHARAAAAARSCSS